MADPWADYNDEGTDSSTSEKQKTPLAGFDAETLRKLYHANLITYEQWIAEYVARGDSQAAASAKVASQDQIGRSTDKKTLGQLTAGEQAAVNALANDPAVKAFFEAQATAQQQAAAQQEADRARAQRFIDKGLGVIGSGYDLGGRDETPAAASPTPPATATGGGTATAPKPEAPYQFGRDSAGLPVVRIKATGQVVHLPPGTEADDLETIMTVVNAATAKPLVYDYYQDKEGKNYAHIYETGKTIKLPDGIAEDSVALQYHIVQNLPKESPNLLTAMQNLEQARQDQGHDEFGRPYQTADSNTRYSGMPLPEHMPTTDKYGAPTQAQIIREMGLVDEEAFSAMPDPMATASSKKAPDPAHGLNFDVYGDPQFQRLASGNLVVDYNEAGNGVTGPTIMGPRVFANTEEAAYAEEQLGRETASNSISRAERERMNRARALGEPYEEEVDPMGPRKPVSFATGGMLELRRPTTIVDDRTGQPIARAAVNGPEALRFGGEGPGMGPWGGFGSMAQFRTGRGLPAQEGDIRETYGMRPTENPLLAQEQAGRYFYQPAQMMMAPPMPRRPAPVGPVAEVAPRKVPMIDPMATVSGVMRRRAGR